MKKLLTLWSLLLLVVVGVNAETQWVKTSIGDLVTGDVVAIVDQTSARAMSNNNGSSAPSATSVTLNSDKSEITSEVATTLQWVVTASEGSYKFNVVGNTTHNLYCNNTNNGVKVGTNTTNNTFEWKKADANSEEYFLYNTVTLRYIGVYNNQDWRCYTTVNSNIKDVVTVFYKKVETPEMYVIGINGTWDPTNMVEMTYNEETQTYSYECSPTEDAYFAIADQQQTTLDWDDFNANHRWSIGTLNAEVVLGQEYTLVHGDFSNKLSAGTYTITVTKDFKMTVTGTVTPPTPPTPATYTVAGNSEALFGTAWSPSTEANDMVANPEVENEYVFTKENVTLEVGTIEYKVVENHSWVVAYPASNAELVIDADGTYNVKFTFNSETKAVNGTATAVTPPAPVEFNKWVVAGSSAALNGKSWDKAATENLMTTTDGKNYELVVTDAVLEKGTNYECKVVLQPTKENPTDDDYIWRPYNNVVFTTGEAETGKYTVTYTYVAPDNIETEEGTLTVATVRTGDADPVEKTYTVAGNSEALFGATWSAASEANDMVANPEVENEYVFTKENVTLEVGTIEYKVVENHAWDVAYPASNAELVIDAAGAYNVKITFNSETKAVTGTATAVTPPAPEIDKLYVIGDGTTNGWDRTAMDEMTWNETTQAFTYEYAPTNAMNHIAIADYQMTADEAAADENWSVFNTHRYYIANIDGSPTLNTEYDLTKGDGSIILAKGTYTISITKGLKITITGEVAPPPAEDTYVVAGNGPATNGVEWDATAEVNKMTTEDNDTYTLVVENAELAADGIYTWKVVKNGSIWIPDGMGNDLTVEITEDGIYTVTYKYVVSTGEETAVAEKTGELVVLPEAIDYPTTAAGITIGGTTEMDAVVKIHKNTDQVKGIKFANGYTTEEGALNANYATIEIDGGFKAGDVISIAGAFNNSDETKLSAVDIFALDAEGKPVVLFTTQQFVNGRTSADDPAVETYTLTADYDELYLGRNGNTGTFITLLKTEKGVTPPPTIDKLYVIGDGTTSGWDRTAMDEMTWNEETQAFTYQFAPTNAMNHIAIADYQMTAEEAAADIDWSVFNTHRYYIANIDGAPTLDTEFDLTKGDGTIMLAAGTYTLTITKDLKIKVTGEVAPPPAEDTYIVAGSGIALNRTAEGALIAWDGTAEENKMTTTDEDTYTLVVENVELRTTDDLGWKVVKNGSEWIPDGMGNDLPVEITEDGIYTVTYTYVVSTGAETAEAVKTGDLPPAHQGTMYTSGDHAIWIQANHYVAEDKYELIIESDEEMEGLGGSFWTLSSGNADLRDNLVISEDKKTIIITATSTTEPVPYTPLYIMMPGEVNFGQIDYQWVDIAAPVIEKLYVIGFDSWDMTNMPEMTWNEETQAFTYDVTLTATGYFAVADKQMEAIDWPDFNANHRWSIGVANAEVVLGQEYTLVHGDFSNKLEAGTYKISVTKDLKMTVTGEVAPPPAEDTYVVAGNGPATNGVEWDGTAEVNKMTTTDKDTYTLVVENATLAADGIYTWKVVKNGSEWIPDGMGNDLKLEVAEDGIYTVTYKYVVSTGEETATLEKTGDIPVVETTWTVAGASVRDAAAGANDILFGLTWDATATDNDMVKGNDGLWTLKKASVALTTNNVITFKVYKNHAFDESYPEENMTCEVTANSVYDVTFTFNEETKVVTVQLTDVAPVTGISAIQTEALNGNVYNMNGQRVNNVNQKGVYIMNGRKVLVK